jgi:hypothetical protein
VTIVRFASGLKDRFHSVGVSGSMKQHSLQASKKGRPSAREIHQNNVERELHDEERKLAELEEKLAQVH